MTAASVVSVMRGRDDVSLALAGLFFVFFAVMLTRAGAHWHRTAERASVLVARRRVTLPAPERGLSSPVGYREMPREPAPPPPAPLSFDPRGVRANDLALIRGGASLAVLVRVGRKDYVIVRIDARRERNDVVLEARAVAPQKADIPNWRALAADELDPMLDELMVELTGLHPAPVPPTRVAPFPIDEEEARTVRKTLDRRGWPRA